MFQRPTCYLIGIPRTLKKLRPLSIKQGILRKSYSMTIKDYKYLEYLWRLPHMKLFKVKLS